MYFFRYFAQLSLFWSISYYGSPLLITFLYRRGYFVVESISTLAKFSTGIGLIIALSFCMRGLGRSQTLAFKRFARVYSTDNRNETRRTQLKMFDYDFKKWPIDFDVNDIEDNTKKNLKTSPNSKRTKPFWVSSLPCELAAYIAVHTFGIRLIYPGSMKIVQSYLR